MPTSQIDIREFIGKRVYAKKKTPIFRGDQVMDGGTPVYWVNPGNEIGVCYSWIDPRSGRSDSYLMFLDTYGRGYYVKLDDKIDLQKIVDQGAKDDVSKTKAKEDSEKSFVDKWLDSLKSSGKNWSATTKNLANLGGFALLIYAVHELSSYGKRKQKQ